MIRWEWLYTDDGDLDHAFLINSKTRRSACARTFQALAPPSGVGCPQCLRRLATWPVFRAADIPTATDWEEQ